MINSFAKQLSCVPSTVLGTVDTGVLARAEKSKHSFNLYSVKIMYVKKIQEGHISLRSKQTSKKEKRLIEPPTVCVSVGHYCRQNGHLRSITEQCNQHQGQNISGKKKHQV